MCNKRESVKLMIGNRRINIDACIRDLVASLNDMGIETLLCCCGHNRYSPTIFVKASESVVMEIFSGELFDVKRTYYKTDDEGFYYVPKIHKKVIE